MRVICRSTHVDFRMRIWTVAPFRIQDAGTPNRRLVVDLCDGKPSVWMRRVVIGLY